MKRSQIEILADYATGMNTMIDACSQMIHQFGNLKWMEFREVLKLLKESTTGKIGKG